MSDKSTLSHFASRDTSIEDSSSHRGTSSPSTEPPAGSRLETEDEAIHLLENLRQHQFELEAQNEELRKAHAATNEITARYMRLFHQAPVGYLVVNRNTIVTHANQTFAAMVGWPEREICGTPVADFIKPDDRSIFLARFRSMFKNPLGKETTVDLLTGPRGRKEIKVSMTYSRIQVVENQEESELLITVSDISPLAEARRKAEASLQFSLDILNSLDAHICVLDQQGVILRVNDAWQRFAEGNGADHSRCGPGANYFHACESARGPEREQAERCAAGIRAVLAGVEQRVTLEYECHAPSEQRWFIARITRLTGNLGGHAVVAHENITDRKRLEFHGLEQQRRINEMTKAESLSRLAEAIAHRYNNTLAAVLGNLELALDHVPRGGEAAIKLHMALQAAWKASDLGGLMLTYLGQSAELMERIDLVELCRSLLPQLESGKGEHIESDVDLPDMRLEIHGNAKLLRKVLLNLAINAWEAMDKQPGGRIRLAVGRADVDEITPENRFPLDWQEAAGPYACLLISDQGCGIAADQLGRIFDPFYSSKSTGRGMGLAVVIGILKAHGGVVTVSSELGKGSTFMVYLPLLSGTTPC